MLTPLGRSRGTTLTELLVAVTLAGIVLGAATSSLLRQQRTAAAIGGAAASSAQLRAVTGAVMAELSALAAASGDIVPGEASDTALQLRAVVASGLACDVGAGAAIFAVEDDDSTVPSGGAARAGDSLWWYAAPEGWRGRRITSADSVVASCPLTSTTARPARRVTIAEPDSIPYGAPLRITRPERYAFYKSGDGSWQLGLRDWSDAIGRFASPQPLAGPLLMRAAAARTGFRYFTRDDAELTGDALRAVDRIARVRVTAIAIDHAGSTGRDSVRIDSVDVALQGARGG